MRREKRSRDPTRSCSCDLCDRCNLVDWPRVVPRILASAVLATAAAFPPVILLALLFGMR